MFLSKMSVVVESRLECVPLAGALVRTFCAVFGASEMESGQIEVCVVEAANNCVIHAYNSEPGHAVEVVLQHHDDELRFEVFDQGRSMNAEHLRQSRRHLLDTDPDSVESVPESGRGLAIIEAVMDTVEYVTSEGRNCFSMTKRFTRESPKS